jgi:hypothetical protein
LSIRRIKVQYFGITLTEEVEEQQQQPELEKVEEQPLCNFKIKQHD